MWLENNADNSDLQPSDRRGIYIGCVDEVNGVAALEVPAFVPTRAELLWLVKYWESMFLDRAFFVFDTGQIGSTDLRICPFAERRVNRIIGILGQDAIDAVTEVRDQFALKIGDREWHRFRQYLGPTHLHGTVDGSPIPRRPHAAR